MIRARPDAPPAAHPPGSTGSERWPESRRPPAPRRSGQRGPVPRRPLSPVIIGRTRPIHVSLLPPPRPRPLYLRASDHHFVLYLAIPAHNEAATIGVLLWRLRSVLAEFPREYEVVVYDDASTDST